MPDQIRVDVPRDQFARVEQLMRELPRAGQRSAHMSGTRSAARIIRDEARVRVPVRTGALKRSIRVRVVGRRGNRRTAVFAGGPGARHAHLVEFGSARTPARPYLFTSARDTAGRQFSEYRQAAEAAMYRYIDRVTARAAARGG